jgi:hypothetical protein
MYDVVESSVAYITSIRIRDASDSLGLLAFIGAGSSAAFEHVGPETDSDRNGVMDYKASHLRNT